MPYPIKTLQAKAVFFCMRNLNGERDQTTAKEIPGNVKHTQTKLHAKFGVVLTMFNFDKIPGGRFLLRPFIS